MENFKVQQTILIVEDEVFIRMLAAVALEDVGFCVLQAGNSVEAVQVLAAHDEIDILMTDVQMPGEMNGLGLVRFVQQAYPAIRSLVVSANVTPEEACDAGAIGFLPKPYMPNCLVRAVTNLSLRSFPPLAA